MEAGTSYRLGFLASAAGVGLGVLYLAVGILGAWMRPHGLPLLAQMDPYLALLEAIIILFAVALILIMAAVHTRAPAERKATAKAALALATSFAVLTCATHFVSLTPGRQLKDQAP